MLQPRLLRLWEGLAGWGKALSVLGVATLAVTILYFGRQIFIPLALAVILSFLLQPLVRLLERFRLPRVPAVLCVVVVVGLLLAVVGWTVARQLQTLVHSLRANQTYITNLHHKIEDLQGVGSEGFLTDLQVTVDRVSSQFQRGTSGTSRTTVVVRDQDDGGLAAVSSLLPLLAPVGTAALVFVLVIFMLINREDLRNRIISAFGRGQLPLTTRAIHDAGRRISRYLLMQFIINSTYGLALAIVLYFIGVPFALLWGFLAAIMRYIPYIGPWLGAGLPIATSVVAFSSWQQPLMVIGLIVTLELISNMVMEPTLYGQSIGVSPVALILCAAFWTWLWGAIGLVLATPLTVCLIVLGQHVPQLRLFAVLFGDEPALAPSDGYYQRLLANDRQEAFKIVERVFNEKKDFCAVCDHVLIPAMKRMRRDRSRGQLSVELASAILRTTREIVEEVGIAPLPGGNARPTATVDAAAAAASQEPVPSTTNDSPNSQVIACAAHHETEELINHMLERVIRTSSDGFEVVPRSALIGQIIKHVRLEQPKTVFIAVMPPSGLMQASYLCRRLRKEFPSLVIVIGYWGRKRRFDEILVKLRARGADYVTTSLSQTQKQLLAASRDGSAVGPASAPAGGLQHA